MKNPFEMLEGATKQIGALVGTGVRGITSPIGNIGGPLVRGVADGITGRPGDMESRRRLQSFLGNAAWAMHPNSFGGRLGKASSAQAEDDIDVIQNRREQMRREGVQGAAEQAQWARGAPARAQTATKGQLEIDALNKSVETAETNEKDLAIMRDLALGTDNAVPGANQSAMNSLSPGGVFRLQEYNQGKKTADLDAKAKSLSMDASRAQINKYMEPDTYTQKRNAWMKANPDKNFADADAAIALYGSPGKGGVGRTPAPIVRQFNDGSQKQFNPGTGSWEVIDSAVSGGQQQINEMQKNRPKYIAMFMKQPIGEDELGAPVFPTYRQATETYEFGIRELKDAQAKAAGQRGGSEEPPVKTEKTIPPRDSQDSSSGTTTGGVQRTNLLDTNLGVYSGLRGAARLNEQYINKPLSNLWGASTQIGNQLIKGSKAAGDWLLRENK